MFFSFSKVIKVPFKWINIWSTLNKFFLVSFTKTSCSFKGGLDGESKELDNVSYCCHSIILNQSVHSRLTPISTRHFCPTSHQIFPYFSRYTHKPVCEKLSRSAVSKTTNHIFQSHLNMFFFFTIWCLDSTLATLFPPFHRFAALWLTCYKQAAKQQYLIIWLVNVGCCLVKPQIIHEEESAVKSPAHTCSPFLWK